MEPEAKPDTLRLTDPRALRAVAHPTRLALVGLLRREGPLTATRAAELLGESPASCSFHLRQLARHGMVEEAGGGHGRQRPWRAAARSTSWPNVADNPDLAAATSLLRSVLAERYFEAVMRWLEAMEADEPVEWQEAAHFGDSHLFVTAEELRSIGHRLEALLAPYAERTANPDLRPASGRPVTFLHLAFPLTPPSRRSER
jgi:DNA-binding transcriptional ArsR family regulator